MSKILRLEKTLAYQNADADEAANPQKTNRQYGIESAAAAFHFEFIRLSVGAILFLGHSGIVSAKKMRVHPDIF